MYPKRVLYIQAGVMLDTDMNCSIEPWIIHHHIDSGSPAWSHTEFNFSPAPCYTLDACLGYPGYAQSTNHKYLLCFQHPGQIMKCYLSGKNIYQLLILIPDQERSIAKVIQNWYHWCSSALTTFSTRGTVDPCAFILFFTYNNTMFSHLYFIMSWFNIIKSIYTD